MFAPTHIPAGIEQKKRTLALSHSVTLPLSQTERQHSWLCKHTSCQTAGWAIRNSVSIFCWYWVRFAFPCPGHSMCINKPLSRGDETHCRMEGCSAPVKLKAEVNGQSKRGERCYGHQWRLFCKRTLRGFYMIQWKLPNMTNFYKDWDIYDCKATLYDEADKWVLWWLGTESI